MFMAGLGTGLDPFRAFVEQRKFQKNKGTKVGPQTPFFGGRYSKQEKKAEQHSCSFWRQQASRPRFLRTP